MRIPKFISSIALIPLVSLGFASQTHAQQAGQQFQNLGQNIANQAQQVGQNFANQGQQIGQHFANPRAANWPVGPEPRQSNCSRTKPGAGPEYGTTTIESKSLFGPASFGTRQWLAGNATRPRSNETAARTIHSRQLRPTDPIRQHDWAGSNHSTKSWDWARASDSGELLWARTYHSKNAQRHGTSSADGTTPCYQVPVSARHSFAL